MATTAVQSEASADHLVLQDDVQSTAFQALEQRVLRAIDLLRQEREQRATLEQQLHQAEERAMEFEIRLEELTKQTADQLNQKSAELSSHSSQLHDQAEHIRRMESDLQAMQGERDQVRQRVERLLSHLDEFTGA